MPKGFPIAPEVKQKVLQQYYGGDLTVKQICTQYGFKARTVYDWIEVKGHGARRSCADNKRRQIRLTAEEIELLLLLMGKCAQDLSRRELAIMAPLEVRLLDAADELTQARRIMGAGD